MFLLDALSMIYRDVYIPEFERYLFNVLVL